MFGYIQSVIGHAGSPVCALARNKAIWQYVTIAPDESVNDYGVSIFRFGF
ncbi:hypothetical protein [Plesiomonas sp.]|jgi:hypothetical protein